MIDCYSYIIKVTKSNNHQKLIIIESESFCENYINNPNVQFITFDRYLQSNSKRELIKFIEPEMSMSYRFELSRILPRLYIGDYTDSLDVNTYKTNRISSVINVTINLTKHSAITDDRFLRIPIHDSITEDITPFLNKTNSFIEKHLNEGILVHCYAGISRSPVIIIAFLMYHLRLKLDEAFKFVKKRRSCICPNFSFLYQLEQYEKVCKFRRKRRMTV